MKDDREETMQEFNCLTPEQQEALENCFGDGNMEVFKSVSNYEYWSGAANDVDYSEVHEKINKALDSFKTRFTFKRKKYNEPGWFAVGGITH